MDPQSPMMRAIRDWAAPITSDDASCIGCHGVNDANDKLHGSDVEAGLPPYFTANPTTTPVVAYVCGTCHKNHAQSIHNSAMNGYQEGLLPTVRRIPRSRASRNYQQAATFHSGLRDTNNHIDTSCRQACHINSENSESQSGCVVCHTPRKANREFSHWLLGSRNRRNLSSIAEHTAAGVPNQACNSCHAGGYGLGVRFTGELANLASSPTTRANTAASYDVHKADIHARAGMQCQDCHSSIDLHGDTSIGHRTKLGSEVECTDCHGSASTAPWDLPLGWNDSWQGSFPNTPRGTVNSVLPYQLHGFVPGESTYLLTARGNPKPTWVRHGDGVRVYAAALTDLAVPQLRKSPWAEIHKRHSILECYACHSSAQDGELVDTVDNLRSFSIQREYQSGISLPPKAIYPHDVQPQPAACGRCHTAAD